jgi:hypothetical protein
MDGKAHEGIRVHVREEGNDDSMWQLRCNIIDEKSDTTCSNKAHWCATSFCSKTSLKWQSYFRILFNKGHGGGCAY